MKNMRYPNRYIRYILQRIRTSFNSLQILFGYSQSVLDLDYKVGCNWASMPHDFVRALVENRQVFLQNYKYSYCPDEIYKQTFAWNSEFKDRLYDTKDEFNGCLRHIDWNRGYPYVYRKADYEELVSSPKLFARKFDINEDSEIIDLIYEYVRSRK